MALTDIQRLFNLLLEKERQKQRAMVKIPSLGVLNVELAPRICRAIYM